MKKIYLILGTIIGILLSGTIVYAARYLASDIAYKDTTVENALNDLYKKIKETSGIYETYKQSSSTGITITNRSVSVEIDEGKYILNANEYTCLYAAKPTIKITTTDDITITELSSISSYRTSTYSAASTLSSFLIESNESGNITINANDSGYHTTCGAGLNYTLLQIK